MPFINLLLEGEFPYGTKYLQKIEQNLVLENTWNFSRSAARGKTEHTNNRKLPRPLSTLKLYPQKVSVKKTSYANEMKMLA